MKHLILLLVLLLPLSLNAAEITYQVEKTIKTVVVVEGHNNSDFTLGSGFFIDSYHIITNYHVINNISKIYIRSYMHPITSIPVEVVGYDQFTDIAILKINNYYPFHITWSKNNIENGQYVYIIGHPLGYEFSLSTGIVASKNRYDEKYPFVGLFQTDALIQTGSSGSPVFNKSGLVIGMIKSTVNKNNSAGISMAIDMNTIQDSLSKIFKSKHVKRPNLLFPLHIESKNKPTAIALVKEPRGSYKTVISVNGIDVKSNKEANDIVQSLNIGDSVTYKYMYNNKIYEKTVILEPLK